MIRVDAQQTPDGELRRQILSKCVDKNEREWWAARRIEKLEFELNAANDRIKRLEEAGDSILVWMMFNRSHMGGMDVDSAVREWKQAKEAKP